MIVMTAAIVMNAVFVVPMAFVLDYAMPAVICSVSACLMQYVPASLRSFACFIFVDLFGKATAHYYTKAEYLMLFSMFIHLSHYPTLQIVFY